MEVGEGGLVAHRRGAVSFGLMRPKELTLRSLILGALITLVFTAANVYLGLKVGLTFASSIPPGSDGDPEQGRARRPREQFVQTVASAAGTLSAIIFVLRTRDRRYWTGFPFASFLSA